MDPLTQGLLGAAAAQATVGHRLGRRALLVGALGGVLPDADVLIRSASDPLLAIEYHRGFTHALAFVPVGGAVAAAPWLLRRENRARWKPLFAAAFVGTATHGLLDACTSYGTQLLWPFASSRIAWDVIAIVDPLFTLVLLLGVGASAVRRVRWPALAALVLCLAYLGFGVIQREQTAAAQATLAEARGHAVARSEVFPTIGNLLVWRSLYAAGDSLYMDRLRVPPGGRPSVAVGDRFPAASGGDLPAPAPDRVRRDFRRLQWLSGGWVAQAPNDPAFFGDARYSLRTDVYAPVWGVRFDPLATPPTTWVDRSREREADGQALWREVVGRSPAYRPLPAGEPAP